MGKLISIKTALHKAIDHLERIYEGKADLEDFSMQGFPHAELSLRIALATAVQQKRPTCLLTESFSPDQAALHMICFHARIALADVADHRLDQIEFARLTATAAQISASPLNVAMCAPFDIEGIAWEILPIIRVGHQQVIVCERLTAKNLDVWRRELDFLSKAGGMEIHLLTGQIASASRFIPNLEQMA